MNKNDHVVLLDYQNQYHFKSEVLLSHAGSNRVHRTKGCEDVPHDFLSLAFNILQQSF